MKTLDYIAIHAHSGLRWIVLATLIIAIVTAYQGWKKNNPFESKNKKIALLAMMAYHIQVVGGIVLLFVGEHVVSSGEYMKKMLMEHVSLMVIGMALITIGYVKAKKAVEEKSKFKTLFIYYFITLILALAAIPWPFRADLAAAWF